MSNATITKRLASLESQMMQQLIGVLKRQNGTLRGAGELAADDPALLACYLRISLNQHDRLTDRTWKQLAAAVRGAAPGWRKSPWWHERKTALDAAVWIGSALYMHEQPMQFESYYSRVINARVEGGDRRARARELWPYIASALERPTLIDLRADVGDIWKAAENAGF